MQKFVDIPSTETLTNSRQKLLDNDTTIMSCSSGPSFPTTSLQVGMFCFRTDLNQLFQLMDLTPTWKLIFDLSKTAVNKEYVDQQDATKLNTTNVVTIATANKILQLDANGNLPTNITGKAASASTAPWSGLSGIPATFMPPVATATVLGGVKQGSGCTIAADGTLSVPAPAAPLVAGNTPMWLRNFGSGADSVYNSTGSFSLGGEYNFTTFILNSGHTLSVPNPGILIIRATSSITIAGVISAVGVGSWGAGGITTTTVNGNGGNWGTGGGTGGGGGHDATQSTYYGGNGGSSYIGTYTSLSAVVSGGSGGGNNSGGGAGGTPSSAIIKLLVDLGICAVGSGGGSGSLGLNGNPSGSGGAGGGCIVLVAPAISFTGTINVSGGSGGTATNGSSGGGGGGGGGGSIVLAAQYFSALTGSFVVNGGAAGGGNGNGKAGGTGGPGWYVTYTIT